ncbi:hypothetical protein AOQ84DRAFT_281910, partial [Glonium stellatum]
RPVLFLHTLVTYPDHHRRGAGAMIMRHILEKADQLSLDTYLESPEPGRHLYQQFSFKLVIEKEFNLEEYGGTAIDLITIMTRSSTK